MASLGWGGSDSWGDDLQAPGRPEHQWEDLTDDQRNNLTQIRVTGQHWNRMLELTEPVRGCFWHQGQQAVRTTQYIKSSTRTATERRQRRQDAAANAATPGGIAHDTICSHYCSNGGRRKVYFQAQLLFALRQRLPPRNFCKRRNRPGTPVLRSRTLAHVLDIRYEIAQDVMLAAAVQPYGASPSTVGHAR